MWARHCPKHFTCFLINLTLKKFFFNSFLLFLKTAFHLQLQTVYILCVVQFILIACFTLSSLYLSPPRPVLPLQLFVFYPRVCFFFVTFTRLSYFFGSHKQVTPYSVCLSLSDLVILESERRVSVVEASAQESFVKSHS